MLHKLRKSRKYLVQAKEREYFHAETWIPTARKGVSIFKSALKHSNILATLSWSCRDSSIIVNFLSVSQTSDSPTSYNLSLPISPFFRSYFE